MVIARQLGGSWNLATIKALNDDGVFGILFFDGFIVDRVKSTDINMTADDGSSLAHDRAVTLNDQFVPDNSGVKSDCKQQ